MKKQKHLLKYFSIGLLTLSLSLVSCEDEITNDAITTKSEEGGDGSICDFEPYGLYFDNGKSVECENNMMHFPSWESFATTLEDLEDQLESHDDDFLIPNQHLSEDDLNDLEESIGHDPDLPLIEYELIHQFCSLRQVEAAAENSWLDASDQPGWTMNDWQENQFLVDPAEQTLYNPYNEVMICNVIYKDMEGGLLLIDANHPDAIDALSSANNGSSIEEVIETYGGNVEEPGAATADIVTPGAPTCFYKSAKSEGFQLDNTYGMRASHQIRSRTFDSGPGDVNVFKAFTRNYKKKRGKMKKRRISSSARIYGDLYTVDINAGVNPNERCNYLEPIDDTGAYRKKRRSKVKSRESHPTNLVTGTDIDQLDSDHRQRPFYKTLTFED
ncbi:hypothetical protein [Nonlabens sp. Asnod3-A02]|uniref:hypothetical protein n=1 Tax=Nonlabens sp. Asnod3-A02 TaxID=3160579 RepID=UPI00386B1419